MKYDSQPEPSENTISTSCQLCLLYVNGVYDFPNIIAEKTIQHTHGNPIWNSKWNVQNLYIGTRNSEFVRKFSADHLYREISTRDVDFAFQMFESLGIPSKNLIRTSDREAYEETMEIFTFLREWENDGNVRIIFQDERSLNDA